MERYTDSNNDTLQEGFYLFSREFDKHEEDIPIVGYARQETIDETLSRREKFGGPTPAGWVLETSSGILHLSHKNLLTKIKNPEEYEKNLMTEANFLRKKRLKLGGK